MYTGVWCGTWISPRNQYVAHGARSWERGILGVHNVGNTAFWTFVPLVYCTNPDGCILNEGSTSEAVNGREGNELPFYTVPEIGLDRAATSWATKPTR
eukprot:588306-Prorocentrum_minimum.AAC.4